MKKILFLVFSIFILSGCTDYKELTDIGIISLIAIDKIDDKYKIMIQVLDSKDANTTANPSVIVYENTGDTIEDAFTNISLEASKKLYMGHVRTFIVTEKLFKDGASTFIDFILRNNEIEKDFNLLLTNENISNIINIIPPLDTIPSENISNSLEISSNEKGLTDIVSFDDFLSKVYMNGIDPILPILYIKNVDSKNDEINPYNRLIIDKKLAIFKEDKFVNYLNEDASIGLNIINKSNVTPIITFKCDKNNYATVELNEINSSLKYDVNSKSININIDLTVILNELNCNLDITNEYEMNKLKEMFENRIYDIISATISEEKINNVDYLGVGKYIYQNNYNFYMNNNIDNIIKNMNENINISSIFTEKASIKRR